MCECILKTLGRPVLLYKSESIPLAPSKQSTLLLFLAEKQSVVSRSDIIRNFASEGLSQKEASRQITYLINRSKNQIANLITACPLAPCNLAIFEALGNGLYQWSVQTDLALVRSAYKRKDFSRVLSLMPRLDDCCFAKDFDTEIDLDPELLNYINEVRDELLMMWCDSAEKAIYQAYKKGALEQVIAQAPSVTTWELSFLVLDCYFLALSKTKSEFEAKFLHKQMCELVLEKHEIQLASFEACLKLAKENPKTSC